MEYLKELELVKKELKISLEILAEVIKELSSAINTEKFDVIGGGFLANISKKQKIVSINSKLPFLKVQLKKTKTALESLDKFVKIERPETITSNLFDVDFVEKINDKSTDNKLDETEIKLKYIEEHIIETMKKAEKL